MIRRQADFKPTNRLCCLYSRSTITWILIAYIPILPTGALLKGTAIDAAPFDAVPMIIQHYVKRLQSAQTEVKSAGYLWSRDAVCSLHICRYPIITSSVIQNNTMMCGVITQIIHSIDHIESRHSTDSVKNINVTFRTARVWLNIAENAEQIYMTWESRPTSSFAVEVGHEALLMLKLVLNIAALRIAGTSMKRLGSATSWISAHQAQWYYYILDQRRLDQRSSSAMRILLYYSTLSSAKKTKSCQELINWPLFISIICSNQIPRQYCLVKKMSEHQHDADAKRSYYHEQW